MNLSKTDRLSPIWQAVKDHLEARLMRLRVMNENESLDAVQTASAPRSSAPEAPADGSSLGRGRRLGRRGAKRLAEQLADGISVARLQDDDRAVVLRDALLVMAGDAEPELIRGHVERVRRDLGVSDAP
jgi:hypothetical protein